MKAVVIADIPRTVVEPGFRQAHRAQIDAIAKRVAKLPKVVDEVTLAEVDEVRKDVKARAVSVNKSRLAITKQWRDAVDEVNEYLGTNASKGLQGELRMLEAECEALTAPYLQKKEEEKRAEELRLLELRNHRFNSLIGTGGVFDIGTGVISAGSEMVLIDDLAGMDEPVFLIVLQRFRKVKEEQDLEARRQAERVEALNEQVKKLQGQLNEEVQDLGAETKTEADPSLDTTKSNRQEQVPSTGRVDLGPDPPLGDSLYWDIQLVLSNLPAFRTEANKDKIDQIRELLTQAQDLISEL